jgi:hypothetical protein
MGSPTDSEHAVDDVVDGHCAEKAVSIIDDSNCEQVVACKHLGDRAIGAFSGHDRVIGKELA